MLLLGDHLDEEHGVLHLFHILIQRLHPLMTLIWSTRRITALYRHWLRLWRRRHRVSAWVGHALSFTLALVLKGLEQGRVLSTPVKILLHLAFVPVFVNGGFSIEILSLLVAELLPALSYKLHHLFERQGGSIFHQRCLPLLDKDEVAVEPLFRLSVLGVPRLLRLIR